MNAMKARISPQENDLRKVRKYIGVEGRDYNGFQVRDCRFLGDKFEAYQEILEGQEGGTFYFFLKR
jgi:hypothetical protein